MAGSITQTARTVTTLDNGEVYGLTTYTKTFTQAGTVANKQTQTLSTTYANIESGAVTVANDHTVCIRNTDAAIAVYVTFDATNIHLTIPAGTVASFIVYGGVTTKLKSASGTPDVEVVVSEV